jgi:hypothetical protein
LAQGFRPRSIGAFWWQTPSRARRDQAVDPASRIASRHFRADFILEVLEDRHRHHAGDRQVCWFLAFEDTRGDDNPLCDVLVADETSMVDVMQALLKAVPGKPPCCSMSTCPLSGWGRCLQT